MNINIKFAIVLILISGSIMIPQTKQLSSVKQESSITYYLTHPFHEVESTSKDAFCTVDVDLSKKEFKKVYVQVDVTSFNSGNSNRDSHAMEVVEALSYPDSRFTSTSIEQKGDSLKVYGKLTFHGITKDVEIFAAAKWTSNKIIVNGNFDISLTAFKVERPSLLLIPVKDDLKFSIAETFDLPQ